MKHVDDSRKIVACAQQGEILAVMRNDGNIYLIDLKTQESWLIYETNKKV